MGPFELIDLIGLDVNLSVARSFYAQGGEPSAGGPSPIQERAGRRGPARPQERRAASTTTARAPTASPIPTSGSRRRPSTRTSWPKIDPAAAEILPRLLAQIANEAAFALEEEVGSPADMDTAMRLGFNWPRGPLELPS